MTMQEKTDRLNQLTLANEELERCVAEKDHINEKLCEKMRDLDERLEVSSRIKTEHEATLSQYKQDVDELLKSSKSQNELVNELKERVNEYKAKFEKQLCLLESWSAERDDLTQQKSDIKAELYSYMTRFSELQIHKENLEMELRGQIKVHEEKVRSVNVILEEKEVEIVTLQERINELNEDLQRRIESEINHLKYFNKEEESLLKTYEEEIDQLKDENEKLKTEVADLSKREEEFVLEKTTITDISQKLIDSKNTELDELNEELDLLRSGKVRMEESIERLNKQIQELRSEMAELEETAQKNQLCLSETFKAKVESLNEQIETLEIEKNAFLKQNESLVIT